MPDEVRRLRAPWPALAREVPNLTADLEREFRFGQRIAMTERGFLMGGTIKGGSSSMWFPATADQYEAYLRWRLIDGFTEEGDPAAFQDLMALLKVFGVQLVNARGASGGDPEKTHRFRRDLGAIYPLLLGMLRELPPAHLTRDELLRIQMGGWGPDAAKGSAYQDGTVYLYDFAIRGARRTLIGLFLHELGHAHEHALSTDIESELKACYARIARANSFFGIEYLLDAAARCAYQRMAFEEFVAETYLAYTACGGALRSFIETQAVPEVMTAWRIAYALFRETFEGFEYE
jgi:hypothetical protein